VAGVHWAVGDVCAACGQSCLSVVWALAYLGRPLALCMLWRAASVYGALRRCVERANKATAMSMVRYRS
jgi:hypothetical protein